LVADDGNVHGNLWLLPGIKTRLFEYSNPIELQFNQPEVIQSADGAAPKKQDEAVGKKV